MTVSVDDIIITNAGAESVIDIPQEVLLRNDAPDAGTSIAAVTGATLADGTVAFTTPTDFPANAGSFTYSATNGTMTGLPAAVTVNGVAGSTINGTGGSDILVADTVTPATGNAIGTTGPWDWPVGPFGQSSAGTSYVGQTFVAQAGGAQTLKFTIDPTYLGDIPFHVLITTVDVNTTDSHGYPVISPGQVIYESATLTAASGSPPTEFDLALNGLPLTAGQTYAFILDSFVTRGGPYGTGIVEATTNGYAGGSAFYYNTSSFSPADRATYFAANWSPFVNVDLAFQLTFGTQPIDNTLNGFSGDDSLVGSAGADALNGGTGADWLFGMAGNDVLDGGADNDRIVAGSGNDTILYHIGDGIDAVDGGTEQLANQDVLKIDNLTGAAQDIHIGTVTGGAEIDPYAEDSAATNATDGLVGVRPAGSAGSYADAARFDEIERIDIQLVGGDRVTVGSLAATALNNAAVNVVGTAGSESVDVTGIDSGHKVLFDGSAGTDSVYLAGHWSEYQVSTEIRADGKTWFIFDHDKTSGTQVALEATSVENFYFVGDGATPVTVSQLTPQAPTANPDANASTGLGLVTEDQTINNGSTYSVVQGTWYAAGHALANDTDPNPYDVLTVSKIGSATLNSGLTNVAASGQTTVYGKFGYLNIEANGSYYYALDNNDADTQALKSGDKVQDVFKYTIKDSSGLTSTSIISINIAGANDAPTNTNEDIYASSQTAPHVLSPFDLDVGYKDNEDQSFGVSHLSAIRIMSLPPAADGTLYYNGLAVSLAGGPFVVSVDPSTYQFIGSLTFVPAGKSSIYTTTFQFESGDSQGAWSTPNTATIHVDEAPVAHDDSYTAVKNVALVIIAPGVLANDTDPDGPSLNAYIWDDPAHGTVTLNADGSFTYTPDANYTGTDSFSYYADDGTGGYSDMATATINVVAPNQAPVNTAPSTLSVNEDTALLFTGSNAISVHDVDGNLATTELTVQHGTLHVGLSGGATIGAGANDSATLTLSGTEAQINAALASLRYQGIANYNGSDTLSVLSTDSAGTPLADSDTVAITINAVNDAPSGTDSAILLNGLNPYTFSSADFGFGDTEADALKAVKISAVPVKGTLYYDADGGDASNAVSVTQNQFISAADIDAGKLFYKAAPGDGGLAYASIGFQVQDSGGTAGGGQDLDPSPNTLTINVNGAPHLSFSSKNASPITENTTTSRIELGLVNIFDDGLGTHNLTLSGAYADLFELSGTSTTPTLYFKAGVRPDYETLSAYTVTVSVDDPAIGSGPQDSFQVTLAVANADDPTVAVSSTVTIGEDSTFVLTSDQFHLYDQDSTPPALQAIRMNSLPGNGKLYYDPDGGDPSNAVAVTSVTQFDSFARFFKSALDAGQLWFKPDADESGSNYASFSFAIQINGVLTDATSFNFVVTAINDAPHWSNAGFAGDYVENSTVIFDRNIAVSDIELAALNGGLGDYSGATLTLNRTAGATDEDVFGFDATGASFTVGANSLQDLGGHAFASFSYLHGALTITFDNGGTIPTSALVNDVLQHVSYANASDAPAAGPIDFQWTLSDGNIGAQGEGGERSGSVTSTLKFDPINDPPVNTVPGAQGVTESAALVFSVANSNAISVGDADAGTLDLRIHLAAAHGTLTLATTVGLGNVSGDGTHDLHFTGSLAELNAALEGLTYRGDAGYTGSDALVIDTDDLGHSGGGSQHDHDAVDITVTLGNQAPALTVAAAAAFTEGGAAVALDPALTIADSDGGIGYSATVEITGVFVAGDTLSGSGSYDAATHTFTTSTLAPDASLGELEAVLRSLSFMTSSDNPTGTPRTLTWTISDGSTLHPNAVFTTEVDVTPVNDTPVLTVAASAAYTEGGTFVTLDPAFAITDVDGGSGYSATVKIVGGYVAGDTLFGNGHFDAATQTFTTSLAPTATRGALEAVLRNLTFTTTSHDPGELRTLEWTISDGSTTNATAVFTTTVDITPVNDAPLAQDGTAIGDEDTVITGTLIASDVDSASLTYRLVTQAAHGLVTVNQDGTFSYTPNADYNGSDSFTFAANDGAADSNIATVSLAVGAINDAPAGLIVPSSYAATEQVSLDLKNNGLSVGDIDALNGTVTVTLAVGEGLLTVTAGGSGASVAGSGTSLVTITGTLAQIDALLNTDATSTVSYLDANPLPAASTMLTLSVNDNGNTGGGARTASDAATIIITAVDQPPIGATGGGVAYLENQAPIAIDPALTIADPDNTTLNGAQVAIVANFAAGQDVLGFTAQNGISGNYNATTGVLTLSGTASLSDYQMALRAVTYSNTSDNPGAATRSVRFSADDGTMVASLGFDTVTILAVNDAPLLAGVAASASFTPHGAAITLAPSLTLSDVDGATLTGATVHIAGGTFAGDGDVLSASVAGTGIALSYNAATETLTLSGTDTLAHYQQVLASVTFQSTSSNPSDTGIHPTRTVEWQVNDGAAANNLSSATTMISIKQAPANSFDATGHGGILWQNADGTPAIWLLSGTTLSSGANVGFNPGASWHAIGTGDFNGDGQADLLWQNRDGTPAVWLTDGQHLIAGANVGFNPGTAWHVIGSGDFDGDGKTDILWQNNSGQAAVWLMDGVNLKSGSDVGFNPGAAWHVITSGDFDGDGKADILWQNSSGQAAVWLMDGLNLKSGSNAGFNPGADWHVQAAGDFNGDGKADILWQNTSGQAAIWMMNGTQLIAGANVGFNPGPAWQVHGTGDFNSDGKADIVWQNTDGTAAVWLMDGFDVVSGSNIGPNPGASWHVMPQHHDLLV